MPTVHGRNRGTQHTRVRGPQRGIVSLAATDATSGKYRPASASEYTALGLVTPQEIWLCQNISGNLVGVNGDTLTAANSPLYNQTTTGWASKGVRGDAATANQRFDSATGPNPLTTDIAVLLYVGNMAPDVTLRPLLGVGTSSSDLGLSLYDDVGNKRIRFRSNAGVFDSVGAYGASGHAILITNDVTNARSSFITDVENRAATYLAATTGTTFGLGAIGGGTFAPANVMYMARFTGASARALSTPALGKAFLQGLSWTISW